MQLIQIGLECNVFLGSSLVDAKRKMWEQLWCLKSDQQDVVSKCSNLHRNDIWTCATQAWAEGICTVLTNATCGCMTKLGYHCIGALKACANMVTIEALFMINRVSKYVRSLLYYICGVVGLTCMQSVEALSMLKECSTSCHL
jgi:hypothetical protein